MHNDSKFNQYQKNSLGMGAIALFACSATFPQRYLANRVPSWKILHWANVCLSEHRYFKAEL